MNLLRSSVQRLRLKQPYSASCFSSLPNPVTETEIKSKYDAIIVGGGHNGLVSAAYLAKAGLSVCVVERRHLLGGAAVTEEIVPGFKFSRASYLLSLIRPQIVSDLELKKHGLKIYLRDPNSFTPILKPKNPNAASLTLGRDTKENQKQIAQFSQRDAEAFVKYEAMLESIVEAVDPLLDARPVKLDTWARGSLRQKYADWPQMKSLMKAGRKLEKNVEDFYSLMTAPASKVLEKWFESEPLKATLATDSVIGAMISPHMSGSGYVLLHHVMGELEGVKGAWGYVEGGMGAVSMAIARCAASHGAHIFTSKPVDRIISNNQQVQGIVLKDGTEVRADVVLSNATPKVTYLDLMERDSLPADFVTDVSKIDYTSPVTKINVAVNALPNFTAIPNTGSTPLPHHRTTIHLNCEDTEIIHRGYLDAVTGSYSKVPVIEMTIPSSLDPTVAPPGSHVVQLFTQYTPYSLVEGEKDGGWTEEKKREYADVVFSDIEKYAPGFKQSIIGADILTPRDIEREFGLTGGNIFHGSMSLDQLYFNRPTPQYCDNRSPIPGLYLCGSGAHPGGGVMGAPGRLAAECVLQDRK